MNNHLSYHTIKSQEKSKKFVKHFILILGGVIIENYGFDSQSSLKVTKDICCDAIRFDRSCISHPDLTERIIEDISLTISSILVFCFGIMPKDRLVSYTDYPAYKKND